MGYFQDLRSEAVEGVLGNKAAGLRALLAHGFEVPPSYVLCAETAARLERGVPEGLVEEARTLLAPHWPVMVRSSSVEEDGASATFAGVFESVMVRTPEALPEAVRRCLASVFSPKAQAYRKALGRPAPQGPSMAVLVQPFWTAELAGVCAFYHRDRIVLEMSRGHNVGITRGRSAEHRFVFDLGAKRLEPCPGAPLAQEDLLFLFAEMMRLQDALFRNMNIVVEFLWRERRLVALQARANPTREGEEELVDMVQVYRRIAGMMEAFGFAPEEWSIDETLDVMAFNYLGARRMKKETMEHFRLKLYGGAEERVVKEGWFKSRYGNLFSSFYNTRFPAPADAAKQKIIEELAREGILVIFALDPRSRRPLKSLEFQEGGRSFSVRFSFSEEAINPHEEKFLKKRLARDTALEHLERFRIELDHLGRILRGLEARGAKTDYDRRLGRQLETMLKLTERRIGIVSEHLKSAAPVEGVFGVPLKPENRVVKGVAVTHKGIVTAKEGEFLYFAYDLEPSFLPYLERIRLVAVSRGAFGSHAAAICSEFNIPLLVETVNLHRVKDGDQVSVSLSDGRVVVS